MVIEIGYSLYANRIIDLSEAVIIVKIIWTLRRSRCKLLLFIRIPESVFFFDGSLCSHNESFSGGA